MSNHTPGPWAVSQNTNFVFGRKHVNGLEPVGFIYGPSFAEDSEVGRRALADTRLCAAAPDLLAALVRLMGDTTGMLDAFEASKQARAAIAKATEPA